MLLLNSQALPNLPDVVGPDEFLRAIRHALVCSLGREVEVTLRGAFNLCSTRVNAIELEDALRQLVLNARDLMPRGGPLEVRIERHFVAPEDRGATLAPGHYLVVGFVDSGLGLTPQTLMRVFDAGPLTREDRVALVVERLRRVRRFAAGAGGALRIESRLGYGARVEVILPAA